MAVSETDVQAASEIEEVGGPKMGEAKGEMTFPQARARAARVAMNKELRGGLPKSWRGGGDYFFEQQDDGSLKITGGDTAKSLTGGKSVTITDRAKIGEILEKARGGDMLEADVTYQAEDVIKTRGRGEHVPEEYGVSIRERLEESTPEAEDVPRVYDGMSEEKGISDLKETSGALRPKREYRNPTLEAVNYLMAEMARRPEIKEQLQRAIDALGVDVQSAERVEEGA